jgi:hypothetical protein
MANPQSIYSTQVAQAYERDGFQDAVADLKRSAGARQHFADDLTRTVVAPANGTAAATVISTRATRVFVISIDASGSAGFLTLYNAAAATVGVTAVTMAVPFPANETTTIRVYPGSSSTGAFATGLTCGTVTLVATSTAIGTAVNKVMFLTSTAP